MVSNKLLVKLIIGLSTCTLLSVGIALAVADDFEITGDDIVSLPTVGEASVLLASDRITIWDLDGDDFTNDPETLVFSINTSAYPNVIFDSTVGAVSITGNCDYDTQDSLVYSDSDVVATLTVSGGVNCADGKKITVAGLKVKSIYAASEPGAAPLFTLDNFTTSPGSPVGGTSVNYSSAIGDLTSTNVEPSNFFVDIASIHTISFTTSAEIPNLGKIAITYPDGWDVSGADGLTAGSLSGLDGTWTAAVSGQLVTLTQTGGTVTSAGDISFTLGETVGDITIGVATPATGGVGGTYTILTENSAGNDIETDTAVDADSINEPSGSNYHIIGETSNLSVSGNAIDGILLTWTDPLLDDSNQIQILRGVAPILICGTPIAFIDKGEQSYLDREVEAGQEITYQVRAVFGNEYGALSEEVTITIEDPVEEPISEPTVEPEPEPDAVPDANPELEPEEAAIDVSFLDLDNHWAKVEIEFMAAVGIVKGNPDGTFLPDSNLNRAQAAALVQRFMDHKEPLAPKSDPFIDVPKGKWYAGYITNLKTSGVIHGNPDGTFEPAELVNLAEFIQMSMTALEHNHGLVCTTIPKAIDSLNSGEWYTNVINEAAEKGYIHGTSCDEGTCFPVGEPITRAEAAVILYNMFPK